MQTYPLREKAAFLVALPLDSEARSDIFLCFVPPPPSPHAPSLKPTLAPLRTPHPPLSHNLSRLCTDAAYPLRVRGCTQGAAPPLFIDCELLFAAEDTAQENASANAAGARARAQGSASAAAAAAAAVGGSGGAPPRPFLPSAPRRAAINRSGRGPIQSGRVTGAGAASGSADTDPEGLRRISAERFEVRSPVPGASSYVQIQFDAVHRHANRTNLLFDPLFRSKLSSESHRSFD